jgi:hypothetical protein
VSTETLTQEIADKQRYAELCAEIGRLKHCLLGSGRLHNDDFRRLSKELADRKSDAAVIQARLAKFKATARMQYNIDDAVKKERIKIARTEINANNKQVMALIAGIERLREMYKGYAIDRTRTEAVRFMANQFAEQLQAVVTVSGQ